MERKPGFYWVKFEGMWTIAEWNRFGNDTGGYWERIRSDSPCDDSEFDEIGREIDRI